MLEELSVDQCLDLLRTQEVGRVGFQLGDQPVVLPVNYRLLANGIVFRTAPGTKLWAALIHARVAFEVDAVDPDTRSGWSVLVVGDATELRDPTSLEEAEKLAVLPWAPGPHEHFVVVHADQVSGRRFGGE